jgi:hypothetical protein
VAGLPGMHFTRKWKKEFEPQRTRRVAEEEKSQEKEWAADLIEITERRVF